MKVSVITVCRNAESTIAETIESVVRQQGVDIDYIVIDGASTDGTQRIIEGYRQKISRFVSESDCGIYDAMNKGLGLASGDVIAFLNADDIYVDEFVIRKVVDIMLASDLDALYGDVVYFRTENPERMVRRYRSDRFSPDAIAWGWMPAHPAIFVRRKVFEEVGGFKTDYRIAGDFEFVARAFDGGLRYFYLPEILVKMRLGGISTRGFGNTLLLNREVIRACKENKINTNLFKILSKYFFKVFEIKLF